MASWLDAPARDVSGCDHRPDVLGQRCELCGMLAQRCDTPAERETFARELEAAYAHAVARAEGQQSWLA